MAVIARRVVVAGRVQGVFFRDSCRTEADRRRVTGWVHNAGDGTVEAVFEGDPDAVQAMCDWCRAGPPRARVDEISVRTVAPEGFAGFEVR